MPRSSTIAGYLKHEAADYRRAITKAFGQLPDWLPEPVRSRIEQCISALRNSGQSPARIAEVVSQARTPNGLERTGRGRAGRSAMSWPNIWRVHAGQAQRPRRDSVPCCPTWPRWSQPARSLTPTITRSGTESSEEVTAARARGAPFTGCRNAAYNFPRSQRFISSSMRARICSTSASAIK